MERSDLLPIAFALALVAACSNEPAPAEAPPPQEPAAVVHDTLTSVAAVVNADTIVPTSTIVPMSPQQPKPMVPALRGTSAKAPPSSVTFTEVEVVEEEAPPPQEYSMDEMIVTETQEGEDVMDIPVPMEEEEVLIFAQEMPVFPGGEVALQEYLKKNIAYPQKEKEAGVQGRVYLQFTVDQDGSLSDLNVMRGLSPALDKEALRVVRSMPKWTPGEQNGKPVKVRYTLPVNYTLR